MGNLGRSEVKMANCKYTVDGAERLPETETVLSAEGRDGMESIADGDPQAAPETMVDDDGDAPSSLLSSDQANGTIIEYSAPPKRYSWYQPYDNPEAIRQIRSRSIVVR